MSVLLVERLCIPAGQGADEPGERCIAGLNRHMNMIRHPAIRMNPMLPSFESLTDQLLP